MWVETFEHNWSRALVFPRPTGYMFWFSFIVLKIPLKWWVSFCEVLNFNWLFLKLDRFICNYWSILCPLGWRMDFFSRWVHGVAIIDREVVSNKTLICFSSFPKTLITMEVNRIGDEIAQAWTHTEGHMNNTWSELVSSTSCLALYCSFSTWFVQPLWDNSSHIIGPTL